MQYRRVAIIILDNMFVCFYRCFMPGYRLVKINDKMLLLGGLITGIKFEEWPFIHAATLHSLYNRVRGGGIINNTKPLFDVLDL